MILAVSPCTSGPLLGYESLLLNVATFPLSKLKEQGNIFVDIMTSNDPLKNLSIDELAVTCVEYTQTILATKILIASRLGLTTPEKYTRLTLRILKENRDSSLKIVMKVCAAT